MSDAMSLTISGPDRTFAVLPIETIVESPWNPRKHWSSAADAELLASVRQVGVLTPLLVRPVKVAPAGSLTALTAARAYERDAYELAAGHRRLRAARDAGLEHVPVQIRPMTDAEFREVLVVENLQRADVHPLDEADAYDALMQADPAYTVEAIAAKVGKSTSYVYQRLKLLNLTAACRQAFERDSITAAHAVRLARLTPEQQEKALEICFRPLFRPGTLAETEIGEPEPVSRLDAWIADHVREVPTSEDTRQYFPELAEQLAQEQAAGTLLELSDSHHVNVALGTKDHGALGRGRWTPITKPKDRCKHVQKGVVVHGGPMRILEVCATKGCPKHFPKREAPRASGGTKKASGESYEERWKREQAQRAREQQAWETTKPCFYQAAIDYGKTLNPSAIRTLTIDALANSREDRRTVGELLGPVDEANFGAAVLLCIVLSADWSISNAQGIAKQIGLDIGAVEQTYKANLRKEERLQKRESDPFKLGTEVVIEHLGQVYRGLVTNDPYIDNPSTGYEVEFTNDRGQKIRTARLPRELRAVNDAKAKKPAAKKGKRSR